jgi:hypothetical protein
MDKQTKDQIVAEQRAADAARNSAVWNALKRTPGLLAGGPVDLANLVLGAITGKGIAGLVKKPVGGSESINEAFGMPASKDAFQQGVEAVTGMLSPSGTMSKAILLLHGGPKIIKSIDPTKLGAVGAIQGPGFYTSAKTSIPLEYAQMAKKADPTAGAISIFDFPDELFSKMLPLTEQPLSRQPNIQQEVAAVLTKNPEIYKNIKNALIEEVKFLRETENPTATVDDVLTGEWLNFALRKQYGVTDTSKILSSGGITGKNWQYSTRFPGEEATVIFPEQLKELVPKGAVPLQSTPEQTKLALDELLKSLTTKK